MFVNTNKINIDLPICFSEPHTHAVFFFTEQFQILLENMSPNGKTNS